ncbi:MAG: SDR family oxidoreductase [Planctomycetota bacterium]
MTDPVLVTGASSGLGLAIARELLGTGRRLVLTARGSSLWRFEAAGIRESDEVLVRALDVTDRDQRIAVVSEIDERFGGVDVLVNNAGLTYRSVVEHVSQEERLAQMDVNFLAPMHLVRLVLPSMRAKRRGRIVNISSVGGMMAMPTMSIYSASKWALEGMSEALWYEVRPWNVRVTLVEPGFIHSRSFENTRTTHDSQESIEHERDPYHAHYVNMAPFIERTMNLARATPERIARRVRRILEMERPPLRAPATADAHLFALMRRLLPRRLYHAVLYRMLPNVRNWGPGS